MRSGAVAGAPKPLVFTNARIVTETEIVTGAVRVEADLISSIGRESGGAALEVDCAGDFLLPGVIDVHTDHLEKHAMPRARVFWPMAPAALVYDAVIAAAGITTVFDSLCIGAAGKPYRKKLLHKMIEGIQTAREAGLLRAEHLLHLRCDILDPDLDQDLKRYIDEPTLRFITILDDSAARHSDDYYRRVQRERGPVSDREVEERLRASLANDSIIAAQTRRWVVQLAQRRGIPVANHDDSRASHIDEAVQLGMSILEFAITNDAADAAHSAGITLIAGAPNVVNGGSHFGNVSAADLVLRGMATILCSDYVPASLVQAAFILAQREGGPSLPKAIATISANPARAFGLSDRGVLAPGRRADIVRVSLIDQVPVVKAVWRQGQRVI
ncbi:alpha-D-ribose 1-methylphosphonate 5-triphosphate diphosphatase [Bradyrhizobium sp. SSUT77]|uniref:alpha-D-ribose 1-methylphosphonate 5-triphosphate diphosphatase n=1 Tax=Bradyrhizobium sp. SSUT77 TaxID=3040603 RepID=UPI00244C81B0|nr:alpha-D-ribose 1-methylphosphonate 5-triphosphate diphosphatase [Bradyrhizobium sp. SSUT77]MDH2347772.1 alpha-D-ribose 1-methylphosphonate 5-triphosphate diphosphatase [Bradyrhizobium sp. SSUT77]